MASEAQVNANRANAQKSTGPRTAEGKAVVAQNALTHGLMARAAVLQGEEWEEYTSFREGMIQELYPDGVQEEELAERIVGLYWRLRRAERYQNAVFETLYDQYAAEQVQTPERADPVSAVASDPVLGRMLVADFSGERVLERALLYERRIESSLHRACADLRQLRRQPVTSARTGGSSLDRRWAEAEEQGWGRRGPAAPALARPASADRTEAREKLLGILSRVCRSVEGAEPPSPSRPGVPDTMDEILAQAKRDAEAAEAECRNE